MNELKHVWFFFRSTSLCKCGSSFRILASINLFQIHTMIFVSELGKFNQFHQE